MDIDFHSLTDMQGNILNYDREILIGKNVWIGCRCTVLKGTTIMDNVVVGANSCVLCKTNGQNKIIAGNPVKTSKNNVQWII